MIVKDSNYSIFFLSDDWRMLRLCCKTMVFTFNPLLTVENEIFKAFVISYMVTSLLLFISLIVLQNKHKKLYI